MIANVTVQSIIIPANQTANLSQTGSKLAFFSNTGTFQFSINGGAFQKGLSILIIDFAAGVIVSGQTGKNVSTPISNIISAQFNTILLQDTSGSANTVTYYVGDGAVEYINPNATNFIKNAATFPKGYGLTSIADAATQTFSGTSGGSIRRTFILQNQGATTLYITDGTNIGLALAPNSPPLELDCSGALTVLNQTGSGAGSFYCTEIYYV
jgi:hypothetical protein